MPYTDAASVAYDDTNIWNRANVTCQDGFIATQGFAASESRYFQRVNDRTILNNNHTEALACAGWITKLYGFPAPKIPPIILSPTQATSWPTSIYATPWDAAMSMANGMRVTFKRRPTYGGTDTLTEFIEQVGDTIVPGMWTTQLVTLPTQDQQMWVLGDSEGGILQSTTYTSY